MENWRCAVLRGWTPEQAQALTPVGAIAWVEGDTVAYLRARWVPAMTEEEMLATSLWRERIYTADPDLPVSDFLDHYGYSEATAVVLCAVPANAKTPSGAADLLLDEILYTGLGV